MTISFSGKINIKIGYATAITQQNTCRNAGYSSHTLLSTQMAANAITTHQNQCIITLPFHLSVRAPAPAPLLYHSPTHLQAPLRTLPRPQRHYKTKSPRLVSGTSAWSARKSAPQVAQKMGLFLYHIFSKVYFITLPFKLLRFWQPIHLCIPKCHPLHAS